MTGLLDTNVALYLLGGKLAESLPTGTYGVSVKVPGLSCRAVTLTKP